LCFFFYFFFFFFILYFFFFSVVSGGGGGGCVGGGRGGGGAPPPPPQAADMSLGEVLDAAKARSRKRSTPPVSNTGGKVLKKAQNQLKSKG
jgi:hypothetical protein